jgi:hypothetical protein
MFYDGGGGALRLRGWFDSELGVQCSFLRARDGQMRCLPSSLAMFADTACAMPVWRTVGCEPTPRYVTAFVPGPAGVVYALGEPYTGLVRNTGLGICRDTFVKSDSRGSYYATGTEIPPERFVAVAMHEVPIEDGKLVVHTMLGADGSSQVIVEVRARSPWADAFPPGTLAYVGSGRLRVPVYHDAQGKIPTPAIVGFLVGSRVGLFDTSADAPCGPEPFADGLRCVPRTAIGRVETGAACVSDRAADASWAPVSEGTE